VRYRLYQASSVPNLDNTSLKMISDPCARSSENGERVNGRTLITIICHRVLVSGWVSLTDNRQTVQRGRAASTGDNSLSLIGKLGITGDFDSNKHVLYIVHARRDQSRVYF